MARLSNSFIFYSFCCNSTFEDFDDANILKQVKCW